MVVVGVGVDGIDDLSHLESMFVWVSHRNHLNPGVFTAHHRSTGKKMKIRTPSGHGNTCKTAVLDVSSVET